MFVKEDIPAEISIWEPLEEKVAKDTDQTYCSFHSQEKFQQITTLSTVSYIHMNILCDGPSTLTENLKYLIACFPFLFWHFSNILSYRVVLLCLRDSHCA